MNTTVLEPRCAFESVLDLNHFTLGKNKENLTPEELLKRGNKIQDMIVRSQQLDKEKFHNDLKQKSNINYEFGAQ